MRTSVKVISALSVAGLAVVAGSAFTASNSLPAGGVSGYGESVASGAEISKIENTALSTDNSKLASVTFTSSTDVTGKTATMTLKLGTAPVGDPYSCILGAFSTTSNSMTITCATTPTNPAFSTFNTTGLTVL